MTDDIPPTDETTAEAEAASPADVERLARRFDAEGRPYARVTVVRREPPVSATVGDRAIVTADGELRGWIGGVACAQSVVTREATAAIRRGEPAFVGLAPDPDTVARPGLKAFPMTCHSEGTLELFVDPVVPVPRLVVVGDSPLSRVLVRLASQLTYDVTVVAGGDAERFPGADRVRPHDDESSFADASFVVVASMGDIDETGVEYAVRAGVPYVALVASEKRAETLFETVAGRLGADAETVAEAVTAPAGLDIGAKTPEEIAVSIVAELVEVRRSGRVETVARATESAEGSDAVSSADPVSDAGEAATSDESTTGTEADAAVDPVCGMDVAVGEAAATVTFEGETYHFCGQGCADAFEDDPGRYLDAEVA
jgi:xanthine dehydrogenase accessory factor